MNNSPLVQNMAGQVVLPLPADKELHEIQRLAELGRLSATLLHEISNPLTAALLHLEQFETEGHANVREVRRNIQLLKRYVEAARQQIRQESRFTSFSPKAQFGQIRRITMPMARQADVQLRIEPAPNCQLFGDPVKFQQIVANLIVNAIEAYGNDCTIGLARPVRVAFTCRSRSLEIKVSDWGEGISREQLSRIFEPFYTTKDYRGHGLGIGLAIVQQYVVNDFKGSISVRSTARSGTVFIVKLPALHSMK